MKIVILSDSGEEIERVEDVEAYELTLKTKDGNIGHASRLSFQDHIKSLILSFDSLAIKASKLFQHAKETRMPPFYAEFYSKMNGWAFSQRKVVELVDLEMTKIARKEQEALEKKDEGPAEVVPIKPKQDEKKDPPEDPKEAD